MSKKNLILRSFLHAVGAALYVFLVVLFMTSAQHIFNKESILIGPMVFLLSFVISAAVMGILILGKPVAMYLDNQKKSAWQMLFCTIVWLALILALLLAIMSIL